MQSNHLDIYSRITWDDIHSDDPQDPALGEQKVPSKFAPILVANNRERVDVAYHKASLFARQSNTYLFRWKADITEWKNRPLLLDEQRQAPLDLTSYRH